MIYCKDKAFSRNYISLLNAVLLKIMKDIEKIAEYDIM